MALYLGSSEINPVETVEVIKEVPTEKDLTLMGNELRRAYCWTRQENVNGMCQLYDAFTNKFSSSFQATNVHIIEIGTYTHRKGDSYTMAAIIDGKLYFINSDSTGITMTQQGTNIGWEDRINTNYYIRNGNIYSSYNNANNNTSSFAVANGCKSNCASTDAPILYINNGYIYQNKTSLNIKAKSVAVLWSAYSYFLYIDDDGHLCYTNKNQTTKNIISNNVFTDLRFFTYDTGHYALIYNKKTAMFFNGTSFSYQYTFDSDIKHIYRTSSGGYVLLTDGKLYSVSSASNCVLKRSDIKSQLTNGYGYNYVYPFYALTTDNKIIKIDNNNVIYTFSSTPDLILSTTDRNLYISCFKFTEDEIITHNLYTTQYADEITKAYTTNSSRTCLKYNITLKTTDTITVNGEVYTRNGSGDLVFDFIPEDLENHTFTDVELLNSYLNAGIIQQNS